MKKIIVFLLAFSFITACDDKIEKTKTEDKNPSETITDNTLDSLNNLIFNDVNNIELYFKRSQYFVDKGETDKGMIDLQKARRIDSTNSEIYLRAGNIMFQIQSFSEAKESYEMCLDYNDTNKFCLIHNARMELLLGNHKKSLDGINKALKVDKYFNEAYYLKGRYYEEVGDTAKAVSSYATVLENDNEYFDAWLQIAVLYTAINSDLAIEYYNTALELNPNSVEALQNFGIFYQNTGREDLAIINYNKAESIMPDNAIVNYNKGFIYLAMKNEVDSAIYEFTRAIEKFPEYHQAHFNLGIANEQKGDLRTALSHFEKSLEVKPDFTEAAISKERILNLLSQ